MSSGGDNPFVGPRALGQSDALHGRGAELARLRDRLVSDRIVLLYSPSGAGKTSLIEAGLRAELRELDFIVPPTIRFGGSDATESTDRYEQAVIAALRPEGDAGPGGATLEDQLRTLESGSDDELCLIFDQFEELFTLDPGDHVGREKFLETLGTALRNRHRWALFVIREDFIAQLDPYVELFPTLLTSRMRLELLRPAAAAEAARALAAASGRPFSDQALARLVDDLRRVKRIGQAGAVPGPYIEPVQLQVVCRRVWNAATAAQESTIEETRIDESGGVDAALRLYYAEQVTSAAAATGVSEALIRSWIGNELVDEHGFRRPAITPPAGGQRAVDVVEALEHAHLLRAEDRHGNRWYELAHDRLVGPVLDDNDEWVRDHGDDPVVRADLWASHRSPELLLSRAALRRAEDWQERHAAELRDIDIQFLAASRARRWFRRGVFAVVCLIATLAVVAGWQAVEQRQAAERARRAEASAEEERREAQKQAEISLSGAWALRSTTVSLVNPAAGLALAAEAAMLVEPPTLTAIGALSDARAAFAERNWQQIGEPLEGHTDQVKTVAFSPDGQLLATGSDDNTIRLWDCGGEPFGDCSGEPFGRTPEGHTAGVMAVAFSPDGRTLASASEDRTVRLWDVETGEPVFEPLGGHEAEVAGVAWSPDGTLLATASWDSTVRLWDVETGLPHGEPLVGHEIKTGVTAVAFSRDGSLLASTGGDGTVRLWDVETGQQDGVPLEDHADKVKTVAFSPDGQLLATGSDDKTARLWNVKTRQPVGQPLTGHSQGLSGVAFSPDGHTLATSSWAGSVWLWDLTQGEALIDDVVGHTSGVSAVAWSTDGVTLATASDDRTVRLWDTTQGEGAATVLREHREEVRGVAWSPDGTMLATVSKDRTARLWDPSTWEQIGDPLRHREAVMSVAWSPDSATLATGSADGTARLWDPSTGEPIGEPLRGNPDYEVMGVAFSPDGRRLVTVGKDNAAYIWDTSTGESVGQLPAHLDDILGVAWSPDGVIATASKDKTARLWDSSTGNSIGEALDDHTGGVAGVAFNPVDGTLATVSHDQRVRLWDRATQQPVGDPMTGHTGKVTAVAWSHDGRMLATTSDDGTARLWDPESGLGLGLPLRGYRGHVLGVAWSPDGKRLATASADKTVRIWDVFDVDAACQLAEPYVRAERVELYLEGRELRACTQLH